MFAQNQIKSLDHATLSFKLNGIMKKINYLIFWDNRPTFDFWMQAVLFAFIRSKMADYLRGCLICHTSLMLDTLASSRKMGFSKKKHRNASGFVLELLRSCTDYGPGRSVKRCGKSSRVHSKKIFLVGVCGFFLSDVISGGLLGHLGPLYLALGPNR